jgi:hypothetical protein
MADVKPEDTAEVLTVIHPSQLEGYDANWGKHDTVIPERMLDQAPSKTQAPAKAKSKEGN